MLEYAKAWSHFLCMQTSMESEIIIVAGRGVGEPSAFSELEKGKDH